MFHFSEYNNIVGLNKKFIFVKQSYILFDRGWGEQKWVEEKYIEKEWKMRNTQLKVVIADSNLQERESKQLSMEARGDESYSVDRRWK